jgi:hypothetical protein
MTISIAQATVLVSDLVDALENVYWEAPSITVKNQCFNMVRILQQEITELTKVSVQDHHYEYETIACPGKKVAEGLGALATLLDSEVLRNQTEAQLAPLLEQAKSIFK